MTVKLMNALLFCLALGMVACDKNDEGTGGSARLRILLTDGPGDYEAVNMDIQDIRINPTGEEEGWVSLEDVHTGVYDLLKLTAGLDTLLADVELPAGYINQIRLVLGEDNTVKVDGSEQPLQTPSAQQSGLKIQLNTELKAGVEYTILLDFEVARSIVKAGNSGKYILKPVIRATVEANTGSILGEVQTAAEVQTVIYAVSASDSLSTFADEQGKFLIRGVPPGSYRLSIEPSAGNAKTIEDVQVLRGEVTDVGTINLQ